MTNTDSNVKTLGLPDCGNSAQQKSNAGHPHAVLPPNAGAEEYASESEFESYLETPSPPFAAEQAFTGISEKQINNQKNAHSIHETASVPEIPSSSEKSGHISGDRQEIMSQSFVPSGDRSAEKLPVSADMEIKTPSAAADASLDRKVGFSHSSAGSVPGPKISSKNSQTVGGTGQAGSDFKTAAATAESNIQSGKDQGSSGTPPKPAAPFSTDPQNEGLSRTTVSVRDETARAGTPMTAREQSKPSKKTDPAVTGKNYSAAPDRPSHLSRTENKPLTGAAVKPEYSQEAGSKSESAVKDLPFKAVKEPLQPVIPPESHAAVRNVGKENEISPLSLKSAYEKSVRQTLKAISKLAGGSQRAWRDLSAESSAGTERPDKGESPAIQSVRAETVLEKNVEKSVNPQAGGNAPIGGRNGRLSEHTVPSKPGHIGQITEIPDLSRIEFTREGRSHSLKTDIHPQTVRHVTNTISQVIRAGNTETVSVIQAGKLGNLKVALNQSENRNVVYITVENDRVKEELQKILPIIQQNLTERGVALQTLEIQTEIRDYDTPQEQLTGFAGQEKQEASQEQDAKENDGPIIVTRQYGYNSMEVIA